MHLNSNLIFRYLVYPQFFKNPSIAWKHVECRQSQASSVSTWIRSDQSVWGVLFPPDLLILSLQNGNHKIFLTLCDFLLQIYILGVIWLYLLFSYLHKGKQLFRQFTWLILSSVIFVVISDRPWPNNPLSIVWLHLGSKFVSISLLSWQQLGCYQPDIAARKEEEWTGSERCWRTCGHFYVYILKQFILSPLL